MQENQARHLVLDKTIPLLSQAQTLFVNCANPFQYIMLAYPAKSRLHMEILFGHQGRFRCLGR